MRLIDADKIRYTWMIDDDGEEHDGITLQSVIRKMPTIEPQRTGRWTRRENNMSCVRYNRWECSECKKGAEYKTDFCPNCGAEMEGES